MKKRELKKKKNYKDYSIIDRRYKELMESGPPVYSEENKPETEIEKCDAILLLIGPSKYKQLLRIMEESGDDKINFGEVLEVAEAMEAEKAKTKQLLEKITSLEVNYGDSKKEDEKTNK